MTWSVELRTAKPANSLNFQVKERGFTLVELDTELWSDEPTPSGSRHGSQDGEITELTKESWEVSSDLHLSRVFWKPYIDYNFIWLRVCSWSRRPMLRSTASSRRRPCRLTAVTRWLDSSHARHTTLWMCSLSPPLTCYYYCLEIVSDLF